MVEGERVDSSLPIDECYRMLPRQRFRGVWTNRREVSGFWPDRVTVPDADARIWLDVERVNLRTAGGERTYLLDFEGRRTIYPRTDGFGFEYAIVVDRVISARPLD